MKLLRSARWLMLALVLCVIPVSSHAGVLISVAVAPPPLLVYDQPPCPEAGWMWTPGYWAYDYDNGGYYWVPGTWVPAPYEGALWTPGFWGWQTGVYLWHAGYWGRTVGYYGGVNYGFGYMGIGFVGGMWRGHDFEYNEAVMHVNRTVIHNTYVDNTVVRNNTIVNDRHVAYSGGPGGINHGPTQQERMAEREQHTAPTSFQQQHVQAAQHDRSAFFNNNHGRPSTVVAQRPMTAAPANNGMRTNGGNNGNRPNGQENRNGGMNPPNPNNNREPMARPNNSAPQNQPNQGERPQYNNPAPDVRNAQPRQMPQQITPQPSRPNNSAPQNQPNQGGRPQQEQQPRTMPQQSRPQPEQQPRAMPQQSRPQPESRPAPQQQRQQPESRPQPQQRQQEQHGQPQNNPHDKDKGH